MPVVFEVNKKELTEGCYFSKKESINCKGYAHQKDVFLMSKENLKLCSKDKFIAVQLKVVTDIAYRRTF